MERPFSALLAMSASSSQPWSSRRKRARIGVERDGSSSIGGRCGGELLTCLLNDEAADVGGTALVGLVREPIELSDELWWHVNGDVAAAPEARRLDLNGHRVGVGSLSSVR